MVDVLLGSLFFGGFDFSVISVFVVVVLDGDVWCLLIFFVDFFGEGCGFVLMFW